MCDDECATYSRRQQVTCAEPFQHLGLCPGRSSSVLLTYKSRGEIAVRVLASAREVGLHTITLSTTDDDAHTSYAHENLQLTSASQYTDVDFLVSLCQSNRINLVHPGYGFLSESPEFCEKLEAVGILFVGPSPETLRRTGDKLFARQLALECSVPVLPALTEPVSTVNDLERFAQSVGFPIIIKAVDGGGGRGIRFVKDAATLQYNFERAVNESSSKKVFAEKAAVDGFKHVEVQIIGDGRGNVHHFWERECSIQRRFQKIIEIAPAARAFSSDSHRALVIEAALRMAETIKYSSLGTWEFLVSPKGPEFYFMEVNPRLQVEHTITEAICGVDLVRCQLLLALSRKKQSVLQPYPEPLPGATNANDPPPSCYAVQFRITAEDPKQNFSPSIGRIRQVVWPNGNGLRVDSHLRAGTIITPDFDSLLAKVIVTGADWDAVVEKADRALQDTVVNGVATNLALLQSIVRSNNFQTNSFDTQWLESNLQHILKTDQGLLRHANTESFKISGQALTSNKSSRSADDLVHKGDTFNIQLERKNETAKPERIAVSVTSVIRNDFPHNLALRLSPADGLSGRPRADEDYVLRISKQAEAQQKSGTSNLGTNSNDPKAGASHALICPIAGQLVEVLVDNGDHVSEGDAVIVLRQMKMELEVRAHRSGIVDSLFTGDEGDNVAVGTIICSILPVGARGKL